MLRCLVVDDEPLARARIVTILAGADDVGEVREAENGEEAVEAIESWQPDVVFLDIQMPALDGFGVVQRIGSERMPVTIFATAFDTYAIQAFDAHALDYLLKPFEHERLQHALERARVQVRARRDGSLEDRLTDLLRDVSEARRSERFVVRTGPRAVLVPHENVGWISAEGNYVGLHVGKQVHLLRGTLAEIERRLDGSRFLRIHRSTIVNVESVRSIESVFKGEYVLDMADGTRLTSSVSYRQRIESALLRD